MLAMLCQQAELQLTDDEARQLAKAIKSVARHYDVGATSKAADFYSLGVIALGIYGARFRAIAEKVAARRRPGPGHNGGPPMDAPDAAPPAPDGADAGGSKSIAPVIDPAQLH